MEKIFLITKDGIKITADLYPAKSLESDSGARPAKLSESDSEARPESWLVLTHMMPATKESWRGFADDLQNLGYESIAIDLRGHGESSAGPDGFLEFSDSEHQKSILDLEAAVDYLIKNKEANPDKIFFIGASIGANLSLQYIGEHREFKIAVLLSPGLNYRGIKTESMVKNLKVGQKVFFISANDDGGNADENRRLYDLTPAAVEKKIKIYETGGHGTDILKNQQKLLNLIINFIK